MKSTMLALLLVSSLASGVSLAVAQYTPPSAAHTASIPIIDLSPAGSPLTFYGSPIPCFEWEENREVKTKAEGEYHIGNVSGRTIVAFVADTEESCMHGGGSAGPMQVDLFFKPAGIAPEQVLDFPVILGGGSVAPLRPIVKLCPQAFPHDFGGARLQGSDAVLSATLKRVE